MPSTRWIFFLLLCFGVSPTWAQTPEEVAVAARKILKKHCHSCHNGEGSSSGEAFDVLSYASMIKEKGARNKPILEGKSRESRIVVRAQIEQNMPPKSVKERPSLYDLGILSKWVNDGAFPFPEPKKRAFLSTHSMLETIHEHLRQTDADVRQYLRYFTLTHLHNTPTVGEEDLRIVRAGLSKAINSMSRAPRIMLPKAIDKDETIFVIDLRDFGWDRNRLWAEVLKQYPYGLDFTGSDDGKLVQVQKDLDILTHRELIYVRADWFVATATRPPLYYSLLQLPETTQELRKSLAVDPQANYRNNKLWRAGFQVSGVSGQNRMVERHDSSVGSYYWESYDFKPRRAKSSLTRFPLGPVFEGNPFDKQAFIHDGGEMIFGLANGLQAYFLADGKGKRIDEGPVDVVSDALKTSGTPAIVNGMSCMNCHKHGMIPFTDTIREGNALFGDAREKVKKLYPEKSEMDYLLRGDEKRFVEALDKVIGPFLKVGEDTKLSIRDFGEPVGEVTRNYLLTDITLEKAAYELGIEKPEELATRIRGNDNLRGSGMLLLANGKSLKRDDWEIPDGTTLFQDVASALNLGTPILSRRK